VLQGRYTGTTWDGYGADRLERWARFATEVEASDEVRIAGGDVILEFLRRLQAQL